MQSGAFYTTNAVRGCIIGKCGTEFYVPYRKFVIISRNINIVASSGSVMMDDSISPVDIYKERLQPTSMLYLVGLLSGAQIEYKPVDLQSYEARNGLLYIVYCASLVLWLSVDVSPVEIDAINLVLRAKANLKRDRKSNGI